MKTYELERMKLYTSIKPNERQLKVQDLKFYAFIHYGINTFTKKEWGNGKENSLKFNPKNQNTDQWCRCIKNAGMKGVILTAKHHDGFCLWPSKTTDHTIAKSMYKNGKGDVVDELSKSAKKYGLKFGVYLSPWDQNAKTYGKGSLYDDFYIQQMNELLDGRYGDIFMLWLDGACGNLKDGKPIQKYNFKRIWKHAYSLQPDICISGCGPDIRWVGNENGLCRESEWSVIPKCFLDYDNTDETYQQSDDQKASQKLMKEEFIKDLGSREFLSNYNEFIWYPAEVDVSICKTWFYKSKFDISTKSINRLMNIYYNSVGSNGLLLLNVPPNREGLISKKHEMRLKEMGDFIRLEESLICNEFTKPNFKKVNSEYICELKFSNENIDRIHIFEDTRKSQRVEKFEILTTVENEKIRVYSGTIIGFSKIAIFNSPIVVDNLTIKINSCRLEPNIESIKIIKTGSYRNKIQYKGNK